HSGARLDDHAPRTAARSLAAEKKRSERRSPQPPLPGTRVDSARARALQGQPQKNRRSAQHQHRHVVAKNEGIRLDGIATSWRTTCLRATACGLRCRTATLKLLMVGAR